MASNEIKNQLLAALPPNVFNALRPDLVLLGTEPFPFQEKHAEEISLETGIPRERMRIADGEYLSWHGSRTPAGIDYAERLVADARR